MTPCPRRRLAAVIAADAPCVAGPGRLRHPDRRSRVWMLVGGAVMVALLGMTLSVTSQAQIQREHAQQIRAIDGCARDRGGAGPDRPLGPGRPADRQGRRQLRGRARRPGDELVVDDGLGNAVTVTATCSGSTKKGDVHQVRAHGAARPTDGSPAARSRRARRGQGEGPRQRRRGAELVRRRAAPGDAGRRQPTTTTTTTDHHARPRRRRPAPRRTESAGPLGSPRSGRPATASRSP